MKCGYCHSTRHSEAFCPHTHAGSSARRHLRCVYCGAKDHDINACPKRYGGTEARRGGTVDDHFVLDGKRRQ